ncbi:MAG TPA: hypothetical protein VIM25_01055 [Candidatus Limnocylindrales bacterium]
MSARVRGAAGSALALTVLVFAVAGCGSVDDAGRSFPVASVGPAETVSPAVDQTRAELVRVLGAVNLVLSDTQTPVRKAESPLMAAAPRAVYQVVLPKDSNKGYIVVYEFTDVGLAAAAATEQQAYLGTGPGRVQTPQGTVTLIRQVGSTVVLYDWLPAAAQDPSAAGIQTALEGLGVGFPVAN